MKSVCAKHQQAHEAGAGCPYCEPDEARSIIDASIARRSESMKQARLDLIAAICLGAWWRPEIPADLNVEERPQDVVNQDARAWFVSCPKCLTGAAAVISGLEMCQNKDKPAMFDLLARRRDAVLCAMRNKGCTHTERA